jgi:hypothetical protein
LTIGQGPELLPLTFSICLLRRRGLGLQSEYNPKGTEANASRRFEGGCFLGMKTMGEEDSLV